MTPPLALDPGPEQSALLVYDAISRAPFDGWILPNDDVPGALRQQAGFGRRTLVVEVTKGYTMPLGPNGKGGRFFPQQVLDTSEWIGVFRAVWERELGLDFERIDRRSVKLHLLGRTNGTDAMVRAALVDRFGPRGTKAAPGRTYWLHGHLWAALAVGVTWHDQAVRRTAQSVVRASA
jgi:hypothetical protein